MSVAPGFENLSQDFADTIQASAASVAPMPDIPPLTPPSGPPPSMPTPPPGQGGGSSSSGSGGGTANWFCKVFPNSILCPSTIMQPGGPQPGTTTTPSVCSIPLIGSYACDLGARFFFVILAIIAIGIGLWAMFGGSATFVFPEAREFSALRGAVKGTIPFAGKKKEAA